MGSKTEVSRAAEDKLTYKLCLAAEVKCTDLIAAYNMCVNNRTVSAAWACKRLYRESGACIAEYVNDANVETLKRRWVEAGRRPSQTGMLCLKGVNDANVETLKRRWVEAGRPTKPDWDALLEGVIPPEHRVLPHRVPIEELKQRQQQALQQQQAQQQG